MDEDELDFYDELWPNGFWNGGMLEDDEEESEEIEEEEDE